MYIVYQFHTHSIKTFVIQCDGCVCVSRLVRPKNEVQEDTDRFGGQTPL